MGLNFLSIISVDKKCWSKDFFFGDWEEFDEPDPEIDKPDEPLQYLSDLIGQQQARLIGNFWSQSGKPFNKFYKMKKNNSSEELFSNTLFTDELQ